MHPRDLPKDSEEFKAWREKLSKSHKGLKYPNRKSRSEESKIRQSKSQTGRKLTDQWKKNTSLGMKKMIASLTDEERQKRIEAWIKTGRTQFDEPISSEEKKLGEFLKSKGAKIQTQFYIRPFYADFYIERENLVVEYFGCFWHRCKICHFDSELCGRSAEFIREQDNKRLQFFKDQGYNVKVVFGHQLEKLLKDNR